MKELHIETTNIEKEKSELEKSGRKITTGEVVFLVRAKSPSSTSAEIPVLHVLSREPESGMRAKAVIQEVKSAKWFPQLSEDDRKARYPASKKRIVDNVIKWSKKNLVLKDEVFPPGVGSEVGVWKVTMKGIARAKEGTTGWSAKYSIHDAIIIQRPRPGDIR